MNVVTVSQLSKCFKLYSGPRQMLKEWVHPFRKKYHHAFWALKDITFSIKKGETLGIIGQNGSGKSTLLQIITQVMFPTNGVVNVNGKISALLELGTGFDAELSGRQNLYLSGSMMGLSKKEIQERIPQIEAFAAIGEFIDQPVKLYSSGMFVRLAFSAAIHVDPDILIIDEALAVGDIKFQNKCYRKFREFKDQGKTIIFVTHGTDLVAKHCDRAILLHQGELIDDGEPNQVINRYLELLLGVPETDQKSDDSAASTDFESVSKNSPQKATPTDSIVKRFVEKQISDDECQKNTTYNPNEHRYGNNKARIIDFLIIAGTKKNPPQVEAHTGLSIYVKYQFLDDINIPIYGLTLKTLDGVEVFGSNTFFEKKPVKPQKTGNISVVQFSLPLSLISGEYFISIGLAEFKDGDTPPLDRRYDMIHIQVVNPTLRYGVADLQMKMNELL
jgi:lipopolysaccharide transport system ATP-binding protein